MHVSNSLITCILWAPNDYRIAWCSASNTINIQCYDEESSIFRRKLESYPRIAAWSPSGRYLAYYYGSQKIYICDSIMQIEENFKAKDIYSLEWIYGDNYLAFAGNDSNIRIWDILLKIKVFKFHNREEYPIRVIKWNEKWRLLATGKSEGSITVWSLRKNADSLIAKDIELLIYGHTKGISSLSWSDQLLSSGDTLIWASGSFDGTIKIWQIKNDPNSKKLNTPSNSLYLVEDLLWASSAPQSLLANSILHTGN